MFKTNPVWNNEQKIVINLNPSVIIHGCAGSGKTLLGVHIAAKRAKSGEAVLILVYTKALRAYIEQTIHDLNCIGVDVYHRDKWSTIQSKVYDVIIVDEAQDFAIEDIKEFQRYSSRGLFVFLDDLQKLYDKNGHKPTLTLKTLTDSFDFPVVSLKKSYRIPVSVGNYIRAIFPDSSIAENTNTVNDLPKFVQCSSPQEELKWMANYIKANPKERIGILVRYNEDGEQSVYPNGQKRDSSFLGILSVQRFLREQGLNVGYKYLKDDQLDFSINCKVNIMTIHGSKGIEFETVIFPFSSYNRASYNSSWDYVALTRTSGKLVFTYSSILSERYYVQTEKELVEGTVRKYIEENDWDRESDVNMMVEQYKKQMLDNIRRGIIS